MVKSLVSKLSSASSTLSIASSFGSSHGKHHHHQDNHAASSTASSSSTSNAISGDNYLKYRNDPGRFFGDGVQFKAKLIGILEVGEARGDRMCQEALQDLKMAIRAAGEHKQRITIHVTIDGLRLRDEKTGDSLYHHPVHKISFIAQDMTDSRAFGYIFGSPDSGHRFFGIKTDKAASQVVLAMRDLFQVVFELKKKEIELARQQIQSKSLHHHDTQHQLSSLSSLKSAAAGTGGQNDLSALGGSTTSAATLSMLNTMVSSSTNTPNTSRLGVNLDSKGASKEISPESVADLVDLEQELSSLQRGITQMERITPNDAHTTQTSSSLTSNVAKTSTAIGGSSGGGGAGGSDDPFGDSFTSFPTLPPPEPGRLRSKTTTKPNDINITNIPTTTAGNSSLLSPTATQSHLTPGLTTGLTTTTVNLQPLDDDDDHWLRELDAHSDVFDTSKTVVPGLMGMPPLASTLSSAVPLASRAPLAARESSDTPPNHIYETVSCSANNMPADMAELSSISANANNNNAADANNTNNLANSSSLSDIFQTAAAAESAQNSKLDIKSDAFTDLDPLGTGRTRPYVDKKYFFQELKNPPKKVLKDLTTTTNQIISTTATTATAANLMLATSATTTMTGAMNLMSDNLTNKNISLTTMTTEDILNLSDFELKSIQYQQQQQQQYHQQQQQHQQQQSLKMTSATNNSSSTITTSTLNTLLTTTSSSSSTATILTATTANTIINLATTGTITTSTTTTTPNPSTASNSCNSNKNATTSSINFNISANNYPNKTAIASSATSTATAIVCKSHASSLAATATSTSTTNATATTTTTINTINTICATNNLNVNVSNIKNNIIASSSCASSSANTTSTSLNSAFTRTSTSLICTCPTSIIVTCTTTNASNNTKKYTTTCTTNNTNYNNNNINNNINNINNIPNHSNNSNTIINNSNSNRNTSSSLLLTTHHHQTKPSTTSTSSKTMSIPMYMPLSMAMNMGMNVGSSGEGGGGGGQDHHRILVAFQNAAIGPTHPNASSSSSSIITTTKSLSSLSFTTTTSTTTTTTITTTTTTTSSTTTTTTNQNSSAMKQTNQTLRFSRYHPPLEPVAVSNTAASTAADPVMLPRDTDPFSPTRKKSDPFEEGGDLFSKLDPFEFEFTSNIPEMDNLRKVPTSLTPPSVAEQLTGSSGPMQASQDLLAGHLQVNLPPEGDSTQTTSTVRSRPVPSAMTTASSGVGIAPASSGPTALPPASMLKQQTVDVISSISNKKMPHLFGQSSRFSKRDSNSINMRRLQESDSLSENETAPEPPPRPDYGICVEPPPLPPKKQFNDFVIRSRNGPSHSITTSTTNQSVNNSNRYDSLNSVLTSKTLMGRSANTDVPPIPLPSRRVGRTDGSYPGPGRPRKPGHTEDDYLAPISVIGTGTVGSSSTANTSSIMSDVPPLLPPPTQTSSRARTQRQQSLNQQSKAHEIYENKSEILQQMQQQQQQQQQQQNILDHHHHTAAAPAIVPDITLTQLLTLGIDELAVKLNVPTSKLSTMTLVELTSYLSEFLEQNKPSKVEHKVETSQEETHQHTPPIFKVNFDQEATFVAKFDDTFGEDFHQQTSTGAGNTFEANFAQFDSVSVEPPVQAINQNANMVPPADRYAVFREIIDQELQQQQESVDLIGDVMEGEMPQVTDEKQFETSTLTDLADMNVTHQQDLLSGDMLEVSGPQPPKIDTKITEVLAQAKDRYAALRDLILVENLFDKPAPKPPSISGDMEVGGGQSDNKSPFQGFSGFNDDEEDQDLRQLMDQASTLDVTTQQQRLGLVDSRGFLVEPSSSAITVEEDEDEEEEERRNNAREDAGGLSSADSNEKEQDKDTLPTTKYEQLASSNQQLEEIEEKPEKFDDNPQISITQSQMPTSNEGKYLSVVSVASSGLSGSKDDLEIDDLMHRAISNLSLDSRERNSPAIQPQQQNTHSTTTTMTPPHFNDVSTSPIPLQRSPLPSLTGQQNKSPNNNNKSPQQVSPLPSQLTVVSQIIDAATKQIQNDAVSKTSNDSWATFDTPQHQPVVVASDKRARPSAKLVTKANNFLNLPPPPGSISNCSQNDSAIESPCSSDPREEAWHKHTMGGSSLSLGHQGPPLGGSTSGQRRYHKKERQNTSSSSRDLSWDEDQGSIPPTHIMDYPPSKRLSGQLQGSLTTDRHGYYRRHARRMNSCDDEYDYEQDYASSRRDRDQCKYKHSLSRSRDNFDMDSPGWYHHHGGGVAQHPHHTWSSQDIEQARGRNFERSAYERTTYGPPIYDKRGVGPPLPPTSSYDRRSAGGGLYDKRGKYYRGDSNPRSTERIYNLDDFDEMLAASGKIPAHLASMYEEMKAECCSPPGHQRQRPGDYMYERDRKSFDRESLESYEGSNVAPRRRRRSYDSGGIPSDPYGSCDSRDEYHGRERCVMTADKSRSLRKSLKSLRVTGDIDYDQDSEKEYHYRDQRSRCDTRSLQRPSQLTTQGVSGVGGVGGVGIVGGNVLGSQSRIRKSSGSSPWDGEEPPLPGQKTSSWKRPSSAAEAERRRAAVKGQTPSGSDEDKDRRYRKKRTTRNKDLPAIPSSAPRYGRSGNYDYISCEDLDDDAEDYVDEEEEEEEDHGIEHDEISPADEDKFARLEMRRHEMHNRMMDAHVRRRKEVPPSQSQVSSMAYRKGGRGGYIRRPLPPPSEPKHPQDYGFDDDDDGDDGEYEQTPTPRSNTSSALPTATPNASTKFSFDVGFESDFNQSSPPPAPAVTASSCNSTPAANVSAANTPASKSSFRFSNDFSAGQDREKHFQHPPAGSLQQYDLENRGISPQTAQTQTSTPKLRFDDNVKVSQFDDAFEDDFSKATFDAFQNDDVQWQESIQKTTKQQIRNNKLQQRQQDLIKKSESVNIFAKKVEDPFEDDEFFNSPPTVAVSTSTAANDKADAHKTINGNGGSSHGNNGNGGGSTAGWDDDNTNFAKFDENM